jgi:hypothetical protein
VLQDQSVAGTLNLEARSRCQMQFIPKFFGDHDAAGLVDLDNGIHNAILPSKMAFYRISPPFVIDYLLNLNVRSILDKGV